MSSHVKNAVMHRRCETVMNLALRGTAGVAGIVDFVREIEQVIEIVALLVVAHRLDYAAWYAFGACRRIDSAIRPNRKRPAGVRVRMAGERVPFHRVGR